MKEEWKDIKGYEGLYQISSYGRVYSFYSNKVLNTVSNKSRKDGYIQVVLYKNDKRTTFLVHRLVAEAFIDNPNSYPQVNHKDEDKTNNCVSNLEWCTAEYNSNYGTRNKRVSYSKRGNKNPMYGKSYSDNPRARKVQCITTGKKFNCIKEAGEYYLLSSYKEISKVCRGKRNYCGIHPVTGEKLKWKYIN